MERARSRTAAQRVLGASARAVDDLTSGQRWTLALMTGLALTVVALGLPPAPLPLTSQIGADTAAASPSIESPATEVPGSANRGTTATEAPASPTGPPPTPGERAAIAPATGGEAPPDPSRPAPAGRPDDRAGTGGAVALVDPEAAGPRGDEAMALHYLEEAGLDARLVPIGDAFETCQAVGGAEVVVASRTVPAPLRACLDAQGVRVVSWDDALGLDAPLTLRRGAARSLLDTAAALAGELDGRLALVADDRLRSVLESVLDDAAEEGLAVDQTVWLTEDADLPGTAVDLAGSGTEVVVFATTVQRQSRLASQLRLLSPGVRFVVLDAADSVVDARYPLAMDGAVAVTSVQFPWHPGAVDARAGCRGSWERAQLPPLVLGNDELLRALLWCQHVDLAADLVTRGVPDSERPVVDGPRASPVTSVLDAYADGGYGPSLLAHAIWSAGCACWSAEDEFQEVGADRDR